MPCNVGGIDKIVRIIAGIAIIGAGVYLQNWWRGGWRGLFADRFVGLLPDVFAHQVVYLQKIAI